MTKIASRLVLATLLSVCSMAYSADFLLGDKFISKDTVAIIDIQRPSRHQLVKSLKDAVNEVTPEQEKLLEESLKKFEDVGRSAMLIVNLPKDAPNPDVFLLIEKNADPKPEAVAEMLYGLMPEAKEKMAPECPVMVQGMAVFNAPGAKLPEPDAERFKAFKYAFSQVPEEQTVTIVFVPNENVTAMATGSLKGDEAEMAKAVLGGKGISLSTSLGLASDPKVNLLVMAADAAAADALTTVATALLAEAKKQVPPELQAAVDILKAAKVGTNVQLSFGLADWAKVGKEVMAAAFPGAK